MGEPPSPDNPPLVVRPFDVYDCESCGQRLTFDARGFVPPAQLEAYNANNVGGDIAGGRQDLRQLFTRPSRRLFDPYATSDPALFLCSSSTPPGGGVHGMCGYHAARSAMRRLGRCRKDRA